MVAQCVLPCKALAAAPSTVPTSETLRDTMAEFMSRPIALAGKFLVAKPAVPHTLRDDPMCEKMRVVVKLPIEDFSAIWTCVYSLFPSPCLGGLPFDHWLQWLELSRVWGFRLFIIFGRDVLF